jgi:histidinol phosphatase-like PHP family hydrolase
MTLPSHATLFHLHTNLTDGRLNIEAHFRFALDHRDKVQRLVFLEHVRRQPTYDPAAFAREIKEAGRAFGIEALVGFEAKILPDGRPDAGPEALEVCEVLGLAEHGPSPRPEEVFQRYAQAVSAAEVYLERMPVVWVHPGLWLQRTGILRENLGQYDSSLREAARRGLLLERNLRYDLMAADRLTDMRESVILGADAHEQGDLDRWLKAALTWPRT